MNAPFVRRAVLLAACLLPAAARGQDLSFYLGDGPNKDTAKPVANVLLRPNTGTPFYAYVANTSQADRTVTAVLIAANGREIARTANVAAPMNSRVAVAFKGDDKPLPLAGNQLRLQLLDEKNKEVGNSVLDLAFQVPTQYAFATAAFSGTRETANELKVTVSLTAPVSDGPVRVKLDLTHVPGLVPESIKDGAFEGIVKPNEPAVLVARNLQFTGPAEKGWVAVSVDDYDRAFLFETAFDGSTPQRPPTNDMITIVLPTAPRGMSKPVEKLPVRIEVDQPARGDLYVEFGFDKSNTGRFETHLFKGDRQRSATLVLAGPEGALVFGSVVKDWTYDANAKGVLGTRTMRARLLAPKAADKWDPANDTELRADTRKVLFDDSPPEGVKLTLPPTHVRGTALKVTATAVDAESGIDRVLFFVGDPPAKEVLAPVRGRVYLAEPPPAAGGVYTAVLPMADVKGPAVVGVRVINGVGLATDATGEVILIDPPAAAAGGKPANGAIKGVVVQGSPPRPQAGRKVTLQDVKKTANLKTVETNAKGEFEIKDVPPGDYNLYAAKPTDYSRANSAVTVEAGKTTEATLNLKRTPSP